MMGTSEVFEVELKNSQSLFFVIRMIGEKSGKA